MRISDALAEAARILSDNDAADARRHANLLLSFTLDKDLTFLVAHSDAPLAENQLSRFRHLVNRRAAGEPLQYITGKQEFYGLEFEVNPSVLIPRPETEFLVEAALDILRGEENQTFCDVGTGSGCVFVAILKNLPTAQATVIDISPAALNLAQRNAVKNKVGGAIQVFRSDCFDIFRNPKSEIRNPKFQVIVSNPPYIPQSDLKDLQREVRDFEPHTALFSGADGLDVVRKLLRDAPDFLEAKGFLLFEIGFGQSDAVKKLIDERIWNFREFVNDLQGIPRVVVVQKNC